MTARSPARRPAWPSSVSGWNRTRPSGTRRSASPRTSPSTCPPMSGPACGTSASTCPASAGPSRRAGSPPRCCRCWAPHPPHPQHPDLLRQDDAPMTDYRYLTYETLDDGRIARILLNRPKTRNAQNRGLLVELNEAFLAAEADDEVRVVIFGGVGPLFSAGHDLGSAEHLREL